MPRTETKAKIWDSERKSAYGVTDPKILAKIYKIFKKNEYDWNEIREITPRIADKLAEYGFSTDWIDYTILSLSSINEDFAGFLPNIVEVFNQLLDKPELKKSGLSPLGLQIILAAFDDDQDGLITYRDYFTNKITRTAALYSQAHPEEELKLPRPRSEQATRFSEKDAMDVSAKIVFAFMQAGLKMRVSKYGGEILKESMGQKQRLNTEFFENEKKTIFVRCGYLYFVDIQYKYLIPEEVQKAAGQNIVFIDQMSKSEFNNRLGYFTVNTITTLMGVDLRNKVVMDCGSGTSNLSLAILKLGAKKVVGFEIDQKQIDRALPNIRANKMEKRISVYGMDLRKTNEVVEVIKDESAGADVVIVSNLGYWGEYPISNLTNIDFVRQFAKAGVRVSDVVTGGLDPNVGSKSRVQEKELLEFCFGKAEPPWNGKEQDKQVLKKLGFRIEAVSDSEVINVPGSFPRVAGSIHAKKI